MNKHMAKPIALIPSLDQSGTHAQLWTDERTFALVQVPEGSLVAQGHTLVDVTYEMSRKEAEKAGGQPIAGIDSLKPTNVSAEQVKEYRATDAIRYEDFRYMVCVRSQSNDTIAMRPDTVSAQNGRVGVLYGLKRELPKPDWTAIESTLTPAEQDGLKKYGEKHWLLTLGVPILIIAISIAITWFYYAFLKH